jgi:hypothetical protein
MDGECYRKAMDEIGQESERRHAEAEDRHPKDAEAPAP